MSHIGNIILDTARGLIPRIKKEHLCVHFNTVSGDSVMKVVAGFPLCHAIFQEFITWL